MEVRREGHWESTNTTSWALMGLIAYMRATGELHGEFDYTVRLNGEALLEGEVSEATIDESRSARVEIAALLVDRANRLIIERYPAQGDQSGEGQLYYTAHMRYYLPVDQVDALDRGIVAALASSARQGVLIKGGSYVEQPARLRAVAFDKTGTLTRGTPAVATVDGVGDWQPADVLRVAAALEGRSAHPLARAIQDHARDRGIDPAPAADVQAAQGKGLTGTVDGQAYWLGSHRQLLAHTDETPGLRTRLDALEGAGQTVVVLGRGEEVCGLIALADTPRPGSRQALADLRAHGVERLVMLTGDNAATARAIAEQVGVDEVRAELLPADKLTAVEELVARYCTVAMVGDGVNDAPAMARASFGVAMGAVGSDAAIETADVALMTDDLSRLPWLVAHGRRTVAVIQQNIVFALALKALFVVLTFAGAATLWGAIAADVGAALLVVFNALRLLRPTSGQAPAQAAPATATVPAASG
jgi:Cd2+/Zn2+-exporting ATPase